MNAEICKLYSRDFCIFLPNIIKIDRSNSELYRFKVGAFFETQCRFPIQYQTRLTIINMYTNIAFVNIMLQT